MYVITTFGTLSSSEANGQWNRRWRFQRGIFQIIWHSMVTKAALHKLVLVESEKLDFLSLVTVIQNNILLSLDVWILKRLIDL